MNNNEVIQDIRRRYEGTYVFLKMEAKGIETLVKVTKIDESPSKIGVLHLDSSDYGSLTLNFGSDGHSLKFKYPPVGVFQHGRDAYLFRRRPQRQYRRGICTDNSIMHNVTRNFAGNIVQWSAEEVADAFNHKVHTPSEALELLRTGKARSVALKDNFTLCRTMFNTPEHIIFNWQYPVARMDEKGKLSRVYEDVFKSQLDEIEKGTK